MKKILWMNYIVAAIAILGVIFHVLIMQIYNFLFFVEILIIITLIITILFFRNKVKISKGLVLTLNIIIFVILFISGIRGLASAETWVETSFLGLSIAFLYLFIVCLPFFNVYILYNKIDKDIIWSRIDKQKLLRAAQVMWVLLVMLTTEYDDFPVEINIFNGIFRYSGGLETNGFVMLLVMALPFVTDLISWLRKSSK
jgi:hypothetical protein